MMLILMKFIGLVVVAMGSVILFNPNAFKAMLNFWRKDKRIYLAGALRLVFGIIFLVASPACRQPIIASILGILMLIGGGLIFILGRNKIETIFNWWEKRPLKVLRLMGIVALTIGALILYSV